MVEGKDIPEGSVWKFGYGSNMGMEFLRVKKGLTPIDSRRCVLHGWRLSFPKGWGFDYWEPAFGTLREDPNGEVHGVSVLFNPEDAAELNK